MKTQNGSRNIVFLSAVRTGFGTFGGALKDFSPVDLTVVAAKAALGAPASAPGHSAVDLGNVLQTTPDTSTSPATSG